MIKKLSTITLSTFSLLIPLTVNADQQPDVQAGISYDMGLGVTALIDNQYSLMLGKDGFAVDTALISGTFEPNNTPLTWYALGGSYVKWGDGIGLRLPIGLNLHFEHDQHYWNVYTQIAPGIRLDDDDDFKVETELAIGIRYKF